MDAATLPRGDHRTGSQRTETPLDPTSSPQEPTVLIVAFRSRWCLPACLDALARTEGGPPRVLVVENGCPERSGDGLEGRYPRLEVLRLPRNLGFAGGANEGLRRILTGGADEVILLNPDTLPDPGWLAGLSGAAAARPDAGILGSLLMDAEGERPERLQGELLARAGRLGTDGAAPPAGDPFDLPTLIGAAMWVRGAVWRTVGGFDPLFFVYGEETDLLARASHRGFRIVLAPGSRVRHLAQGSSRTTLQRARVRWWLVRNDGLLLLKRPHLSLRTGVLDLPFRLLRRAGADLLEGRLLDLLFRALSLPVLLALLPAISRSRRGEAAGPAHLGPPGGDSP